MVFASLLSRLYIYVESEAGHFPLSMEKQI